MVRVRTTKYTKKREEKELKKAALCILPLIFFILTGCVQSESVQEEKPPVTPTVTEKPDFTLEVTSEISPDECCICGKNDRSLMSYYSKFDSVGVVHLNDVSISDTEVRSYDDYGNEIFHKTYSSMRTSSFGNGYGSVSIHSNSDRGLSDTNIYYTSKDETDFDIVKDLLCQDCLDKVVKFYIDQKNHGNNNRIGTTGYCLVDFQTKELYTLSDPYRGYFIRDYYVTFDIREDTEENGKGYIDMLVVYAPERES